MVATSNALNPRPVDVPTTPGPVPTTMALAPKSRRAISMPDTRFTASRSPPKAWPTVTVPASRPFSRRAAARSESASGKLPASVIT